MPFIFTQRKKDITFLCFVLFFSGFIYAQKNNSANWKQTGRDLLNLNLQHTGLNKADLASAFISDAYPNAVAGTFLVYLQQGYKDIPVFNKLSVYIFKDKKLVEKKEDFISKIQLKAGKQAKYAIDPQQAIRFAANHLNIPVSSNPVLLNQDASSRKFEYSSAGISREKITSDLVWLPVNNNTAVTLCWNVRIVSDTSNDDWYVRIDANTGQFVEKNNLTVYEQPNIDCKSFTEIPDFTIAVSPPASFKSGQAETKKIFSPPSVTGAGYRVYPFPLESPNYGPASVENNPWLKAGLGNNAITLGWHFDNVTNYNITRGNNVWAQEDLAGTNATSGNADTSTTSSPVLTFNRSINSSLHPSITNNLAAATTNLFYWNNIMHDLSYQYGFTEATGNFQAYNSGRGGEENDYVNAFAQDGAGVNNANFGTPPDGANPRMRMYLFTTAKTITFHVNNPAPVIANYVALESNLSFKNKLTYNGPITGNIVLADDVPPTTHLACGVLNNSASLLNNIALIDRGTCAYQTKIKIAQDQGAIGVIVINNIAGAPVTMAGFDTTITIPAIMISQADGAILKANLAGLNGSISATGGTFRDGDLDNGVISHEYTHGISNRLTGGPANVSCLTNAEQMGEGWSDYMALMVTTDWSAAVITDGTKSRPIGTYAVSQAPTGGGIRTFPYSTDLGVNPWDYANLAGSTGGQVHTIGEIWCATVWDMTWNIIQSEGIDADLYHGSGGNNIALQLVMEGMKYQPCSPGFLDGRDAILKADSILYNYRHKCAIWNAFARRGMGKSALQGSSNSYTDQTAAHDLPNGLSISKTVDKTTLQTGDNVIYTIKAYCDCSPLSNISIIDTLSNSLNYVSSSGGIYTAPYVHFDGINFNANETKTFTIQTTVNGSYIAPVTLIDDSRDPASYAWTTAATVASTNWINSNARSHSPSNSWYAKDEGFPSDFTLTSGNLLLDTISTLSFWHYYETESAFDGGVVEISTNGGASWQDLGPYMTQNPYNNTLDPLSTGIGNRKAFSGSSGGVFIQTVISLAGFQGTTALIRFRFTSDPAVDGEGWYIDDIVFRNEHGINNIAYAYNGVSALGKNSVVSLYAALSLPVNFLTFDAKKQNTTAVLHWKVSGEINNKKYLVERSSNGINFNTIGEVETSTGTNSEKDYFYTDLAPLKGNNFYRIAQVDLDGKSTNSATRQLEFNNTELIVRVSPVPTYNHTINVEIQSGKSSVINAQLVNSTGQTIKSFKLKEGNNVLDLESSAPGVYFLKVFTSFDNPEIRKIIVR